MSSFASTANGQAVLPCRVIVDWLLHFLGCLIGLSILMGIGWGTLIDGVLYNCTDGSGIDYFLPGDWVHGAIVSVPHVMRDCDMGHPDTVRAGWGIPQLWLLWSGCFASTIMLSLWLSRLRWRPFTPREPPP